MQIDERVRETADLQERLYSLASSRRYPMPVDGAPALLLSYTMKQLRLIRRGNGDVRRQVTDLIQEVDRLALAMTDHTP